jgi:hypothetical protein
MATTYLLETGTDHFLLEDGTSFLLTENQDYAVAVAEASAAADAPSARATFVSAVAEAGAATDAESGGLLQSSAIVEPCAASDVTNGVRALVGAVTEAGAATEASVAVAVFAAAASEAASAADTAADADTEAATVTELSGGTSDAPSARLVAVAGVTEAASATDAASLPPAVYSVSVTEAASATDTVATIDAQPVTQQGAAEGPFNIWIHLPGPAPAEHSARLRERSAAGDVPDATLRAAAERHEAARATESSDAARFTRGAVAETVRANASAEAIIIPFVRMIVKMEPGFAVRFGSGPWRVAKAAQKQIRLQRPEIVNQHVPMLKLIIGRFLAGQAVHLASQGRRILTELQKDDAPRAGVTVDWSGLVPQVVPPLEQTYRESGSAAYRDTGAAGIFDQVNERALVYAKARAAEMVGMKWNDAGELVDNPDAEWAISETTRASINELIQQALDEGMSPHELADAITSATDFSAFRAEMVARTELAKAQTSGALAGWKESGLVSGKSWLLGSENVDDECTDNADEGVIDIDETFSSGDDAPPAHPNCACDCVAELMSAEEEEVA